MKNLKILLLAGFIIIPKTIFGIVGFGLNELTAFSEVRSHYSLFLVIGIMAFISVSKFEMMGFTYKIYVLVFGSFLIGRFYSVFADGMPNRMLWYVILAELAVVLIALWRLRILNSH